MMPPPLGRKNPKYTRPIPPRTSCFNDAAPIGAEEQVLLAVDPLGAPPASMMPPPLGRKNLAIAAVAIHAHQLRFNDAAPIGAEERFLVPVGFRLADRFNDAAPIGAEERDSSSRAGSSVGPASMMPPPLGRKNPHHLGGGEQAPFGFNDAAPIGAEERVPPKRHQTQPAGASMMPPPLGRKNGGTATLERNSFHCFNDAAPIGAEEQGGRLGSTLGIAGLQ